MKILSRSVILLALIIAGLQIVVNGVFRDFVDVDVATQDEFVGEVERSSDLERAKSIATGRLSQLFVRNRAAHDFWRYSSVLATANGVAILFLMFTLFGPGLKVWEFRRPRVTRQSKHS